MMTGDDEGHSKGILMPLVLLFKKSEAFYFSEIMTVKALPPGANISSSHQYLSF